jgi:uncharacterized Zn finger protein
MVREHPIMCSACGKESGYTQEGLMFFVVSEDLHCKYCGEVVVVAVKTEFDNKETYSLENTTRVYGTNAKIEQRW